MRETKKLYKIELRGMTGWSSGVIHGISYVVAANPNEAYKKVRKYLDDNDLGFSKERELKKIELIAEDSNITGTQTMLFI